MHIRLSRLVTILVTSICVVVVVFGLPTVHPTGGSSGVQSVSAGGTCFAWGVNGAPNTNNAPTSLCTQCATQGMCAATDGTNFFCGSCGAPPPTNPPLPTPTPLPPPA